MSRTITANYAVVLLTILVHIQLNLIGQHTYVDSLAALDPSDSANGAKSSQQQQRSLSFQIEQKYLYLTWHFLNIGVYRLREIVEEATQIVFERCVQTYIFLY